jgi:hypothetical protein
MGVTIHYAGRLRTRFDLEGFLVVAEKLAEERRWHHERFRQAPDHTETGFVTYPHPDCEPIQFVFDQKGRVSGWVKTQFAGPETHIEVVGFLRQLRSHLVKFGVRDEGEYWETGCEDTLRGHIETINRVIREYVESNPNIRTCVHLPSGLIVDYIE